MRKNVFVIFYMFNLKNDHFGLKMKPYIYWSNISKANLHVYNKIEAFDQHYFSPKSLAGIQFCGSHNPCQRSLDFFSFFSVANYRMNRGAQWLSGRVLDSRPRGCWFEPHRNHCVMS